MKTYDICRHSATTLLLFLMIVSNMERAIADEASLLTEPSPRSAMLGPQNVAVVVNEANPDSVAVGRYYMNARRIPDSNLVKVYLPGKEANIKPELFEHMRRQILSVLDPQIQVIVLVWTTPYKVGCNSITSALTLGYDASQCTNSCSPGQPSRYFDANSRVPFKDFGIRPSMLLPVESVEEAKVLIDRGVISSFRTPPATAYLVTTADPHRNTRAQFFPKSGNIAPAQLSIQNLHTDAIADKQDIMFYFTGASSVAKLDSLGFVPGALADHLTSAGGDLLGRAQMSSLRWLQAGATASYGTVSEPCNYWQKFPNPIVAIKHYLRGETAVESYWKSVAWPAQGLFIGEPLAAPYCKVCN